MQIIRALLDGKGGSPGEIVKSLGLGKAEDDAVQKAVREAVAECGRPSPTTGRKARGASTLSLAR